MKKIEVNHSTTDFESYRAQRVKSLFNAESGATWQHTAELPINEDDWQIGLIVGSSGSGKTSLGKLFFEDNKIYNAYEGWDNSKPIVDCIAPDGDFNKVTGALASVGLGDVPSWLRPFKALSNGQQFRAGMARLIVDAPDEVVQWAIKMKDTITGGTVFWLNSGIDRGDIAYQDFIFIEPKYFSMKLKEATARIWREDLQPLGIELMGKALDDIPKGIINRKPQKESLSTFEPSMDIKDVFKPDLLMIEQYSSKGNY